MEHLQIPRLLDARGNPLSTRIESVLRSLIPKFRKRFPALRDELELTEILEKAGTRIALREERSGPIEKLHAYAWVALRSVATSWLRRGRTRLAQKTIASAAGDVLLSAMPAQSGTPEQIQQGILLREAMERLSLDEWLVCNFKRMGFSSEEIARRRHSSTAAVNMVFSRAKQKLRRTLTDEKTDVPGREPLGSTSGQVPGLASRDTAETETVDGEPRPAS
jgi:DNA-directed RNA polymerase specialized sigma24 family protein